MHPVSPTPRIGARRRWSLPVFALIFALTPPFASAWDSDGYDYSIRIVHSTHSYFIEGAVEKLKPTNPQLVTYLKPLLEGANLEIHNRPIDPSVLPYWVDLETKRKEHKATEIGSGDIEGWWLDAQDAYQKGHPDRAYFILGIILHYVQDMGVPANAQGLSHGRSPVDFDSFEFMAAFNWVAPSSANPEDKQDPRYDSPAKYYAFSKAWTLEDTPNYRDTSSFSNTWALATSEERTILRTRQRRTALVTSWALSSALASFAKIRPSAPDCDLIVCRPLYVYIFKNAPMAGVAKENVEAAVKIWAEVGIRFIPHYSYFDGADIEKYLGSDLQLQPLDILGEPVQLFGDWKDRERVQNLKPSTDAFGVFFVKTGADRGGTEADFDRTQVYIDMELLVPKQILGRTVAHEIGHLLMDDPGHTDSSIKKLGRYYPTSNLMLGRDQGVRPAPSDVSAEDGLRARERAAKIPP